MATSPAWYGRQRPDHYRRHAGLALEAIGGVTAGVQELADLLAYYQLLWPEQHDDAPDRDGYCACGRWAETCPARQAAEAGELTWTDEAGDEHALDEAAPAEQPQA